MNLDHGSAAPPDHRPPTVKIDVPHSARIYDYWLGGKDNFAVDREVGEAMGPSPLILDT